MKKTFLATLACASFININASELVRIVEGDIMYFDGVMSKKDFKNNVKCHIEGIDTPESSANHKVEAFANKHNISVDTITQAGVKAKQYSQDFFMADDVFGALLEVAFAARMCEILRL